MSDKKKLLIYAHYYVPDVASTGQILRELAEGMLDTFDITIICVVPSYGGTIEDKYKTQKYYKENINGVNVLRIRVPEFSKANKFSRVKNILGYFFGAAFATFKVGKQDYVFSISQPPVLGGLVGVWGKWVKRAKYIYNIQDFNPEQIIATGYSKSKFILSLMMFFDKFSCTHADKVITVGRDLVDTLKSRYTKKNGKMSRKIQEAEFIKKWLDEKAICTLDFENDKVAAFRKEYGLENKFVFQYSGNIGLYYDLINILKVIQKFPEGTKTCDGRDVVFAFVGDGSIKDELVAQACENDMKNVVFIPYQDKADLNYSLNAADVHWCVNAKGIKGVSVPSKLYGEMATGKPVIGVLEEGSEARLIIEETNCGRVFEPGEYEQIEQNISWFIEHADDEILTQMGRSGRAYLEQNLTKGVSVDKYKETILES